MKSTLYRLADIADNISLPAWQDGNMAVTQKADGSPVTDIDVAIEVAIRAAVNNEFPGDGFCGEEVGEFAGAASNPGSQRTWIVDGIDGTRSFTSGSPGWSTHIALTQQGIPTAGMVTCPAIGRRWYAAGPTEAHVADNGQPSRLVTVSRQAHLGDSLVARWPFVSEVKPSFTMFDERIATLTGRGQPLMLAARTSVSTGAMLVAEGQLDAFVMFGGQPWDHAAPAAIVLAAGGRFSCLAGSNSLATGAGIYSNGRVHDALVDALQARCSSRPTSR